MKRLFLVIFAIAVTLPLSTTMAEQLRDPDAGFFEDTFGNLPEELEEAVAEGRTGMLVMFETTDCPWCRRMEELVLNRVSVQDYYREHFRIIKVNADGDAPITAFNGVEMPEKTFALEEHRVRATPTFVFFGSDGEPISRFVGVTKDPEEFVWLGQYIVEGHYQNMRFPQYKRNRKTDND